MKSIKLQPVMLDEDANNLVSHFLEDKHIHHLIEEDTEVFKENGDLLCVLKKK